MLAADGEEASGALVKSPWSMPVFFAGWIGLGVLVGAALGRRGHDRRLMIAQGAGLGPLMAIVVFQAMTTRRAARPLVLAPGLDHGGDLDVLVLIQEGPESVRSVIPTLTAVAASSGTSANTTSEADRHQLPCGDEHRRGGVDQRRFPKHRGRTLVLHAIDESTDASVRW